MPDNRIEEHKVTFAQHRTKMGYWHTAKCTCGWSGGSDNFAVLETQAASHDFTQREQKLGSNR